MDRNEIEEIFEQYDVAENRLLEVKKAMSEIIKKSPIALKAVSTAIGFKSDTTLNNRFRTPQLWTFEEMKRAIAIIDKVNDALNNE